MTVAMDTEIRPDRSGPRNLAVLLMIGSILVLLYGYADLNSHRIGLSDAEAEDFVLNPSLSGEDNSTIEDYRAFEDDARANSAFLVRSVSLLVAGSLVLIGGAMLFRLKRVGAYLSVAGASIGLIGGVLGSIMIHRSAEKTSPRRCAFVYLRGLGLHLRCHDGIVSRHGSASPSQSAGSNGIGAGSAGG